MMNNIGKVFSLDPSSQIRYDNLLELATEDYKDYDGFVSRLRKISLYPSAGAVRVYREEQAIKSKFSSSVIDCCREYAKLSKSEEVVRQSICKVEMRLNSVMGNGIFLSRTISKSGGLLLYYSTYLLAGLLYSHGYSEDEIRSILEEYKESTWVFPIVEAKNPRTTSLEELRMLVIHTEETINLGLGKSDLTYIYCGVAMSEGYSIGEALSDLNRKEKVGMNE